MNKEPDSPAEPGETKTGPFDDSEALANLVELPLPNLETISVAFDGSERDAVLRLFADALSERAGAGLNEITIAAGVEEILTAAIEHQSDLLIVGVPFGPDRKTAGGKPPGPVAEQLLLNCHCPVLCLGNGLESADVEGLLDHILVPVSGLDELAPRAVGWAFRLTRPGGQVELMGIADTEIVDEATHLVSELAASGPPDPDELLATLRDDICGLVAAAGKRGKADERVVVSSVHEGRFVSAVTEAVAGHTRLVVWAMPRATASLAFHRGTALLQALNSPVLLVV